MILAKGKVRIVEDITENKTRSRIDYSQYKLKWEEQFEGDSLNRDDWNVELHEPGWVNEELQMEPVLIHRDVLRRRISMITFMAFLRRE